MTTRSRHRLVAGISTTRARPRHRRHRSGQPAVGGLGARPREPAEPAPGGMARGRGRRPRGRGRDLVERGRRSTGRTGGAGWRNGGWPRSTPRPACWPSRRGRPKPIPELLRAVCQSVGWEIGVMWRVDPRDGVLHCSDLWHDPDFQRRPSSPSCRADSRSRRASGFPAASGPPASRRGFRTSAGTRTSPGRQPRLARDCTPGFAFPITVGGETLGVMEFFSREIQESDDDLLRGFTAVGGQIGQFLRRERAEEEAAFERYLLHSLLDTIPDSVYFKDEHSRFIRVSRAMADRHGLGRPDSVIGKTDFDIFTEEHARPAFDDEQEIMRSGKPVVGKEEKETRSGREDRVGADDQGAAARPGRAGGRDVRHLAGHHHTQAGRGGAAPERGAVRARRSRLERRHLGLERPDRRGLLFAAIQGTARLRRRRSRVRHIQVPAPPGRQRPGTPDDARPPQAPLGLRCRVPPANEGGVVSLVPRPRPGHLGRRRPRDPDGRFDQRYHRPQGGPAQPGRAEPDPSGDPGRAGPDREAGEPRPARGGRRPRDQQPARLRHQQPRRHPPRYAGGRWPRSTPTAGGMRSRPRGWRRKRTSITFERTSPGPATRRWRASSGSATSSATCATSPGSTRPSSRRPTSTPLSSPRSRSCGTRRRRRTSGWRRTSDRFRWCCAIRGRSTRSS